MFPNLNAEMARANFTALDLAKVTHKNSRTMKDKLAGRSEFTWNEVLSIRNGLFPDLSIDYLFSNESRQSA